jgi:hypothetical protein
VKVLILGAGASKPACYPVAEKLMPTIEADAKASRNIMLMSAWEHWERTKKTAPGALRLLLEDPNPEVVLSVLDLCAISRAVSVREAVRQENRDEFVSHVLSDTEVPDGWLTSFDHKWLGNADAARFRLLDCLIAYFEWRHHSDRELFERRAYLREELDKLRPGDVVITLNWDTLAERSLWEAGRWSPRDGYGFLRDLRRADSLDGVSGKLAKPSEIYVLKLHGSLGWYRYLDELYLADDLLNDFLSEEDEDMPVCDLQARKQGQGRDHDPVIAYPSFLKRLDVPEILEIWRQADTALRNANEIEIWGYSLPESDAAMRALLNPLRGKAAGTVQIHVAGDGRALDRWRTFLPRATVDHAKLGLNQTCESP